MVSMFHPRSFEPRAPVKLFLLFFHSVFVMVRRRRAADNDPQWPPSDDISSKQTPAIRTIYLFIFDYWGSNPIMSGRRGFCELELVRNFV